MEGLTIVIMGVTGSGKSTVGKCLADTLQCTFVDADDYHSHRNKEKMSKGEGLTDDDRLPWLQTLRTVIERYMMDGKTLVLACSALKKIYRDILRGVTHGYEPASSSCTGSNPKSQVIFVCLKGSLELLTSRLRDRAQEGKHFMDPSLLPSQLKLLEFDQSERILEVDIHPEISIIIQNIVQKLSDLHAI